MEFFLLRTQCYWRADFPAKWISTFFAVKKQVVLEAGNSSSYAELNYLDEKDSMNYFHTCLTRDWSFILCWIRKSWFTVPTPTRIILLTGLRDALSLGYWQLCFYEENYFKLESGGFSKSLKVSIMKPHPPIYLNRR